jgi:hypothetical protein
MLANRTRISIAKSETPQIRYHGTNIEIPMLTEATPDQRRAFNLIGATDRRVVRQHHTKNHEPPAQPGKPPSNNP